MRAAIPVSEWTRGVISAVDRLDADGFAAQLTENAWLRVGSAPAVVGRDAVRATLAAFFAGLRAIDHEVTGEWREDDTLIVEAEVTYAPRAGAPATIPVATVFRRRDGAAYRCQLFGDFSALLATMDAGRDARPADPATAAAAHVEETIDEASEESFPASDPPSWEPLHPR